MPNARLPSPVPNGLHVWVVTPPKYTHVHAFDEVVLSLARGFAALGLDVPVHRGPAPRAGVPLVIGANLLRAVPPVRLPPETIVYNLEQIYDGSAWLDAAYLAALRRHRVWDYSRNNVAALAALGVPDVRLVPIGWVPELERIPRLSPAYDVIFVGSLNPRRTAILDAIAARGLQVARGFDLYERERDLALARAKIVLNIHALDAKVFEIVRVSYALANGLFVVSETGADRDLEQAFVGGIAFGAAHELPDLCVRYAADDTARRTLADEGRRLFRAMPIEPGLAAALALPSPALELRARATEAVTRAFDGEPAPQTSAPTPGPTPREPTQALEPTPAPVVELLGPRRAPYYVVADPWSDDDEASQAPHRLARALLRVGEDVWVANLGGAQTSEPFSGTELSTPLLSAAIARAHLARGVRPIVVYPGHVSGNPLRATTIARLVLDRAFRPASAGAQDLVFASEAALAATAGRGTLLRLPALDPRELPAEQPRDPSLTLVYGPDAAKDAGSERARPAFGGHLEIGEAWPTRAQRLRLFARARVLYVDERGTDERGPIVTEAALAGCPVAPLPIDPTAAETEPPMAEPRAAATTRWFRSCLEDLRAFVEATQALAAASPAPDLALDRLHAEPALEGVFQAVAAERDAERAERRRLEGVVAQQRAQLQQIEAMLARLPK